jgi:hypothetical protein
MRLWNGRPQGVGIILMKLKWIHNDLYIGRIYAGSVMLIVPTGWRERYANLKTSETTQHIKDNIQSTTAYYEKHEQRPWRAWIMTDEDGTELGWFATQRQAGDALEEAVRKYTGDI